VQGDFASIDYEVMPSDFDQPQEILSTLERAASSDLRSPLYNSAAAHVMTANIPDSIERGK
jgi:hypothetical protein